MTANVGRSGSEPGAVATGSCPVAGSADEDVRTAREARDASWRFALIADEDVRGPSMEGINPVAIASGSDTTPSLHST